MFIINLKYLPDISKWDTSKVTDMSDMFARCISLEILPDINKWNISNVINKKRMFNECKETLKIPEKFTNN